jgi:hypothetical protein
VDIVQEVKKAKANMVWTSWSGILHSEEIRRTCGEVDIAEKMKEARLTWYGQAGQGYYTVKRSEERVGRWTLQRR